MTKKCEECGVEVSPQDQSLALHKTACSHNRMSSYVTESDTKPIPAAYGADNRDPIRKGMAQHAARENARANAPKIGAHMATLNLFREDDGTFRITVAEARGFIDAGLAKTTAAPIYFVEGAIIEAAETMKRERS